MASETPRNLTLGAGPSPARAAIDDAVSRLQDVQAALRIGRTIEAHEVLLDVLYDLRAAQNDDDEFRDNQNVSR